MTQHVPGAGGRVVHEYVVDTLGAPFKVVLIDSVLATVIEGEEVVEIPDLNGLIGAVVRSRVLHPQKLLGDEIKFIRNALGVRAKSIAEFLDMSPEHMSRCEAGVRVLSPSNEKDLRLFAFMGTFYKEPEHLFTKPVGGAEPKKNTKLDEAIKGFVDMFFSMRIQSAFDASETLCFQFIRQAREAEDEEDEQVMEYELQECLAAAA